LLKGLYDEIGMDKLLSTLPLSQDELDGYLKMVEFDINSFNDTNLTGSDLGNMRGLTIIFTEDQAGTVLKAIDAVREEAGDTEVNNARAVELISADYLAGAIPDDKPSDKE
jgi:hypothetical protein